MVSKFNLHNISLFQEAEYNLFQIIAIRIIAFSEDVRRSSYGKNQPILISRLN